MNADARGSYKTKKIALYDPRAFAANFCVKGVRMPSPFPGMDPYFEGSSWTSVHTELAVQIAHQLTPLLRPKYMARPEKRFVMGFPETEDGVAISDVDTRPDVAITAAGARPAQRAAAGAAPLELETLVPIPIPHLTVEIRDVSQRRLVTAIELLSPTNKRSDGRGEYLAKRARLLGSPTHVIEIDLLRNGERVPMRQPLPSVPYFVFRSRAEQRPMTQVWAITLDQPLPTIPVPLLPGDADVLLDLQKALSDTYDLSGYDLECNYTRPPQIPLDPEQAAWAQERLRQAGFGS
jgi:hypothetical protein